MASSPETVRLCGEIGHQEVSLEVVSDIVMSDDNQNLKLLIVGEAAQGKSTLINGLVGKQVAEEGDSFSAGTDKIKHYSLNQNGVTIEIWDTPAEMVETFSMHEWDPDLTLFCFRMDGTRFPTRLHSDTIKKLTELFGKSFWNHTLFVLTFANNVSQLCSANEEPEEFFSNRVIILEETVQETLQKEVGMSDDELQNVRAVPVGTYRQGYDQWKLQDQEDWFPFFWTQCVEHIKQASVSALLQANCHRRNASSTERSIDPVSEIITNYASENLTILMTMMMLTLVFSLVLVSILKCCIFELYCMQYLLTVLES